MVCKRCKYSLPLTEFSRRQRVCMKCRNMSRYGLSSRREYDQMIVDQGFKCLVCLCDLGVSRGRRGSVIDHDHTTGAVRGVIHGKCNLAVGYVENVKVSKSRLISYLSRGSVHLPPKSNIKYQVKIQEETQSCVSCGKFYPLDMFQYTKKDNTRRKVCNICRTIIQVRHLDYSQYQFLMGLSDSCWICEKKTEERFIDHDYSCCNTRTSCENCVRGVLSRKCKSFLGHCDESPEVVESVYEYLKGAKKK